MTEKNKKTFFESFISISIDVSKAITEEFPSRYRPFARVPIFFLLALFSLIAAPIVLFLKLLRKSTINPFFKLRTELETKWYGGAQDEALSELRKVREILIKNEGKLSFKGVQIPPYGKFKFDEFTKILWLLYHWEFHSGNFHEATEVCDYFIEKGELNNSKRKSIRTYWEEWVLNKAKAIHKTDGGTAAQEYLLKFVNTQYEECRINKYLYELREGSKKIV